MKRILLGALLLSGLILAVAQVKKEELATKNTASPGAETSVTINGKNIWIYYHAPSVRGAVRCRVLTPRIVSTERADTG